MTIRKGVHDNMRYSASLTRDLSMCVCVCEFGCKYDTRTQKGADAGNLRINIYSHVGDLFVDVL